MFQEVSRKGFIWSLIDAYKAYKIKLSIGSKDSLIW